MIVCFLLVIQSSFRVLEEEVTFVFICYVSYTLFAYFLCNCTFPWRARGCSLYTYIHILLYIHIIHIHYIYTYMLYHPFLFLIVFFFTCIFRFLEEDVFSLSLYIYICVYIYIYIHMYIHIICNWYFPRSFHVSLLFLYFSYLYLSPWRGCSRAWRRGGRRRWRGGSSASSAVTYIYIYIQSQQ